MVFSVKGVTMRRRIGVFVLIVATMSQPASACSLCGDLRSRQSLREELARADLVVVARVTTTRLIDEDGNGSTDLHFESVIVRPSTEVPENLTIQRYLPETDSSNRRGIFFFRRHESEWALVSWRTCSGDRLIDYLKSLVPSQSKSPEERLRFFSQRVDDPDAEIATDAYLEIARLPDTQIVAVARSIGPERLRRLLSDSQTPAERIGLWAFLLACCGEARDLSLIQRLMKHVSPGELTARRGLLAAHIVLQPRQGWQAVLRLLSDPRQPFLDRHTAWTVVVFMKNWQPETYRPFLVQGFRAAILDGDLADLAVEELRRSQWWDFTTLVLEQYARTSHDSPLVRRAILRYAASCPAKAAGEFLETIRQRDPDLVAEIVRSLKEDEPARAPK
jgi:hypothetical protein